MWLVIMIVLGGCIGSFVAAQVWRSRARQLAFDKKHQEPVDPQEYARLKPLLVKRQRDDYSRCLHCSHRLAWYDLIPVTSWLMTAGRCRYCKARIGWFELVMELLAIGLFVLSYVLWPWGFTMGSHVVLFALWLIALSALLFLAAYDVKWQLLPDSVNLPLIVLAGCFVAVRAFVVHDVSWLSVLGAIGMLAGLYGVLYVASRGQWIGFGDVKLGVSLGLLLADWKLAFFALFAANLIGCLLVLPGVLRRELGGQSKIAFGPLLIAGTLIAFWWGAPAVSWLFTPGRFM